MPPAISSLTPNNIKGAYPTIPGNGHNQQQNKSATHPYPSSYLLAVTNQGTPGNQWPYINPLQVTFKIY